MKVFATVFASCCIFFTLLTGPVLAQEPEMTEQEMEQMMGMLERQMAPMMKVMMKYMMEGMFDALADSNNTTKLAAYTKNFYDALIAQGFTKQEAMQLVIGVGAVTVAPSGGGS